MTIWQHWIVGQVDASIAAAFLLTIALLARRQISPRVRSVILLIALVRLTIPPWIRSPWSEAAVDLPPIDDTRTLIVDWLQSDAAAYAFAITTIVSVLLLARLAWQLRQSHRHWLKTTTMAPESMQARARALMSGDAAIEVRLSMGGDGPLAAGIRRRLIVLPADAIDLEPAALDAALAHEAAHHARGDLKWIAGVRALAAVAWFNPLAHLIARAIVASREDGSDDWAVSRTSNDAFTYCRSLLQSARMVAVDRDAVAANAHPMGRRLRRLLDGRAARDRRLGVAGLIGITVAMALCLPGAHMPEASSWEDDQAVIVHRIIR
jgi:bla regulator protein BlaR1